MQLDNVSKKGLDSSSKDTANGIEQFVDRSDREDFFKTLGTGAAGASKELERNGLLPQFTIDDSVNNAGASKLDSKRAESGISKGEAPPPTERDGQSRIDGSGGSKENQRTPREENGRVDKLPPTEGIEPKTPRDLNVDVDRLPPSGDAQKDQKVKLDRVPPSPGDGLDSPKEKEQKHKDRVDGAGSDKDGQKVGRQQNERDRLPPPRRGDGESQRPKLLDGAGGAKEKAGSEVEDLKSKTKFRSQS